MDIWTRLSTHPDRATARRVMFDGDGLREPVAGRVEPHARKLPLEQLTRLRAIAGVRSAN
jgi:hypothetical protein